MRPAVEIVPGVAQAEGGQEPLLEERGVVLPRNLFDEQAQQDVARVRILEPGARREVQGQVEDQLAQQLDGRIRSD